MRGDGVAPLPGPWHVAGAVAHVFTHFSLRLELAVYSPVDSPVDLGADWDSLPGDAEAGGGRWWPLARLAEAGLPTLYAKAARLVWPQ